MSAPSWNLQRRMCNTGNIISAQKDHYLPGLYSKYPGDYLDLYTYNNLMIKKPWLGPKVSITNGPLLQLSPVTGGDKILIICVDFSDKPATVATSAIFNRFFGDGNTFKNYYTEVSNGIYIPDGIIVGWYRAPQTYVYYRDSTGCDFGLGAYPHNIQKLFEDALDMLNNDPTVTEDTLSGLDIDGDGYLNRVFVIHAGGDASHIANCNEIWPFTIAINLKTIKNKTFSHFSITSEYIDLPTDSQRSGVDCHEFGHIIGLPDLYNTTNFTSVVGVWSLMDQGEWGIDNTGITPSQLDPWCKNILGWLTLDNNQTGTISVGNIENYHVAYKYTTSDPSEYFIIENRQKIGFDNTLPGDGILIWHINELKDQYSDINCRKVSLIQADNRKDIENKINPGDADDPYPGGANNRSFNDTSNPNSQLCNGTNSFLDISNISDSQTTMSITANLTNIGNAHFMSNPSGARIWVDNIDRGLYTSDTITGLAAGNHTYKLTLSGYLDATGNFTVYADTTTEVLVTFTTNAGAASFVSNPSGARIWVDNIDKDLYTPNTIIDLIEGSHTYKLTLTGYLDETGIFSIISGVTTDITVTFTPNIGDVSFTSIPSGAEIWIDDIDRGLVTPNMIAGLSVGYHTYKLTLSGYQEEIGSFSINPGLTTIIPIVELVQEIQFDPRLFGLAFDLGIIIFIKWLYDAYKGEKKQILTQQPMRGRRKEEGELTQKMFGTTLKGLGKHLRESY